MDYFPSFKYVDVGNTESKWERIPLANLEKYRAKFNNTDFCRSVARYENPEPKDNGSMIMGITIDLDGDNLNLDTVLNEARLLRDYFYRGWELKKEEVRFYYSGNRSIHIEIQPETINITPHERLNQYIKETVRAIADKLELDCVDYSIYARRHLYRCIGTVHGKTNKYKVEVDPSELNFPSEELKKFGDTDRGYLYPEEEVELTKNEIASESFRELFEIAQNSIDESHFRGSTVENLSLIKGLVKFPACVQDLLEKNIRVKGTRNRATLALVSFFKDLGKTKTEIKELLVPWAKAMPAGLTGADERKRVAHVESLTDYIFSQEDSEYHFACQFILSLGSRKCPIVCKSRCLLRLREETRKKITAATSDNIISTAYHPEVGGFLTELVYDSTTKAASFALYNPQNDTVNYVEKITVEYPKIYVPLVDENVHKNSVLLPSRVEEYGSDDKLYKEVNMFIAKYYHEPIKRYRTFYTLYAIFSWVYDRFPSWCYLQFLGRAGGGKSRGLESIGHICYRPIILAGADTSACMLRMLDQYRGTAVIDEATFTSKSEAHLAVVQILNVGYKIDGSVGRCEGDDNRPVRYMVGSPKILASRDDFSDDGLRSRCFVRRTGLDNRIKEGEDKQPVILSDTFKQEAAALRNKLLLWRFRHWKGAKLNLDLEISGVESRINEIIIPVLSVMDTGVVRQDIEELAREQQEDLRQQRQSSLEGEILKAIQEIGFGYRDIQPSEIRDAINKEKDKKEKPLSTHSVTKTLKKMELKLKSYGNRYLLESCPENSALLERLYRDYDLAEASLDIAGEEKNPMEGVTESEEKDTNLFTNVPNES